MNKVFSVSIIGCGSRGQNSYGKFMYENKEMFKIASICDTNPKMLEMAKIKWQIEDKNCFLNPEEFFKEKRSDALVIATQDRDHVRMCVDALKLGYDILLEKPISPIESELYELLDAQKKYGGKVIVCHVLRYAPAFCKIKEILDSGKIGKLVCIEWLEQVAYWHQIHSFVRGNWRNDSETSPMILQKCCHDLDLLQYYVNSKCKTVYSLGELTFFKKENKPEGAAARCHECKYINDCLFSAEVTYVGRWKKLGKKTTWPFDVVDLSRPITEQSLREAYKNTQYGKCVFDCDNNVCDNQKILMEFENGVKADLTMTGFTAFPGRKITLHGTLGEIEMDEWNDYIRVTVFGEEPINLNERKTRTYSIKKLIKQSVKRAFGHGGGEPKLMSDFYKALDGKGDAGTTLERSVESHLMALCAEKSRKTGKVCLVHERETQS